MDEIWRRKMSREFHQKLLLMLEGFGWNLPRLGRRPLFHAESRPLEGLLVHILQAFKTASRQKVRLHRPKAAFLAGLAVGVTLFMTNEPESVLLGERFHLRHDHGILACPSQTRQIRVVDNADGAEYAQNFRASSKKHFIRKRLNIRYNLKYRRFEQRKY